MSDASCAVNAAQIDGIIGYLSQHLDKRRFHHTLGVLQSCLVLSPYKNVERNPLMLAALLHDCAKPLDAVAMREMAACDDMIDPSDFDYPPILHAAAGTVIAREKFGISDPEVLDAIRYHPTGRDNPSAILRILIAADYTEPSRDFPAVDDARRAVRQDLDNGLLQILKNKADYVLARGRKLHHRTIDTINSLEGKKP